MILNRKTSIIRPMAEVFPEPEEAVRLAVGPESITWRRAGDARTMFGAGAALLLQVAHPTVAAGVREHSNFKEDPWGRLWRTLDYVHMLVYGGPENAVRTGRAMRAMHQKIKGTAPDGRQYHALEPEAYAWVHATLALTIIGSHDQFGRPFSDAQRRRFYAEWLGLGRLLGIRERDLPGTWEDFLAYVEEMCGARLEPSDVVDDVLESLADPKAPPVRGLGPRTWKAITAPSSHTMRLATIGLLPEPARKRLGLQWTRAMELELNAIGRLSRSTTPVLPQSLRIVGPRYLRWRRDEIARGPFGQRGQTPQSTAA
jgi:uncharacterized protein (DUF2236 family)